MATAVRLQFVVVFWAFSALGLAATRFVPLGAFPGGATSSGVAISADGKVVVGLATGSIAGKVRSMPFYWTESSGMRQLDGPVLDGRSPYELGAPLGVSGDGTVVFGRFVSGSDDSVFYKWTVGKGVTTIFGPGPLIPFDVTHDGSRFGAVASDDRYAAIAISADGSYVVGSEYAAAGYREAYRDHVGNGGAPTRQWLGRLPGNEWNWTLARELSPSGQIVVGWGLSDEVDETGQYGVLIKPVLWTAVNGLAALPGVYQGSAHGVSATGQVVFGEGSNQGGPPVLYRWTPGGSLQALQSLLASAGVDPAIDGWEIQTVAAMSAHGRYFVGNAIHSTGRREAYLIELDIPGDFDGNGPVDGRDLLKWQRDGADAGQFAQWTGNYWSPLTPLAPAATNGVPEPAAALLTLAALAWPSMARRR